MEASQLRQKFLNFFQKKGHVVIPSASLVPSTEVELSGIQKVLFTTAGMHPLIPYLLGEAHPEGKKLVNVQKSLRTDDIDEIGDIQHLTFFEMLGYWSLGDYFKKESIHYTFDFFTEILGFKKEDISVTIFAGDEDAPFDQEVYDTWKNDIGIPEERIYRYPKKENWWGPISETGPCGPCTEIFVDTKIPDCGPDCGPACKCDRFVEIGNNVFMEYFKNLQGKFGKLSQKNVDVGLGLERLVMLVQNKETVFETDLFEDIVSKIKELAKFKGNEIERSVRIIADHLRAATFALADGVQPSNLDRGYVVRRLIRRSIRHGKLIGINEIFTPKIAVEVIKKMSDVYPELKENEKFIFSELNKEEEKFSGALQKGIKRFGIFSYGQKLSGKDAFDLFQTYGFPIEITEELAKEKGLEVDMEGYQEEYKKHQQISRKGLKKKFAGGLASQSPKVIAGHTATHILHQALRDVLGNHVQQTGSNITEERIRFDFSHPQKMTEGEIEKVEKIVNEKIVANLPIKKEILPLEKARQIGAIGLFGEKYSNKVSVYSIGNFSKEICGGPHVGSTKELGKFKIVKEEGLGSNRRRIYAVLD